MKNILRKCMSVLLLVGILSISVSCGNNSTSDVIEKSNIGSTKVNEVKVQEELPLGMTLDKKGYEIPVVNYKVNFPYNWQKQETTGGYMAADGPEDQNFFHFLFSYDDQNVGEVTDIKELPQVTANRVKDSLYLTYMDIKSIDISISSQEEKEINGYKMLRVEGKMSIPCDSLSENDKLNFAAYYCNFSNEKEGIKDMPVFLMVIDKTKEQDKITDGAKVLDAIAETFEAYSFK